MNKKGQIRFNFGAVDGFSLIMLIIGLYLLNQNNNVGWLMIILAFVKQFSGR